MSTEKSVTSEGVPAELDLGNVEVPTETQVADLDAALDAAGLGENEPAKPAAAVEPAETDLDLDPEPKPAKGDPEPKPAEGEPETKPAETTPPIDEAAKKAAELEAIDLDKVKAPDDVSPRNLVNFNKLRDVAKHYKSQIQTTETRLQQLEARNRELESRPGQVPENMMKELEDHRKFRKLFDAENDPEFKRQFSEKLGALDEDVLGILRKNGLPEETEKQLKALGLDKVSANWWENEILPKLPFVDRERIQKRLAERADVTDQRSKELEKFSTQRDQWFEQEKAKVTERFQAEQNQIDQHLDLLTQNIPWARYQEVPANATADDRAKIEAHNKSVAELEQNFRNYLFPKTPAERAEIAAAAVASTKLAGAVDDLAGRLRDSNARAEKLEKELEAIRSAGRSPASRPANRRVASEAPDASKLSDEDAIEAGLAAAEGLI
jgi:outer membrane murein-binding lipoprotein Lpp/chaperonin cofactor prefoldin